MSRIEAGTNSAEGNPILTIVHVLTISGEHSVNVYPGPTWQPTAEKIIANKQNPNKNSPSCYFIPQGETWVRFFKACDYANPVKREFY